MKSWLLAFPHYLVLGFFLGVGIGGGDQGDQVWWPWTVGLVGLLVVVAGVVLLFRKNYPGPISTSWSGWTAGPRGWPPTRC